MIGVDSLFEANYERRPGAIWFTPYMATGLYSRILKSLIYYDYNSPLIFLERALQLARLRDQWQLFVTELMLQSPQVSRLLESLIA